MKTYKGGGKKMARADVERAIRCINDLGFNPADKPVHHFSKSEFLHLLQLWYASKDIPVGPQVKRWA